MSVINNYGLSGQNFGRFKKISDVGAIFRPISDKTFNRLRTVFGLFWPKILVVRDDFFWPSRIFLAVLGLFFGHF